MTLSLALLNISYLLSEMNAQNEKIWESVAERDFFLSSREMDYS